MNKHRYKVTWTEKYSSFIETDKEVNDYMQLVEKTIDSDNKQYEGIDDIDYKKVVWMSRTCDLCGKHINDCECTVSDFKIVELAETIDDITENIDKINDRIDGIEDKLDKIIKNMHTVAE